VKKKLTKEGSKLYENIVQLKCEALDGKMKGQRKSPFPLTPPQTPKT